MSADNDGVSLGSAVLYGLVGTFFGVFLILICVVAYVFVNAKEPQKHNKSEAQLNSLRSAYELKNKERKEKKKKKREKERKKRERRRNRRDKRSDKESEEYNSEEERLAQEQEAQRLEHEKQEEAKHKKEKRDISDKIHRRLRGEEVGEKSEAKKAEVKKQFPKIKPETRETKKRSFSFFDRQKNREFPIIRICFTGGPSAGKTTALAECAQELNQHDIKTFIIPEAEAILEKGGFLLEEKDISCKSVKFNTSLIKIKIALEDILTEIAGDFYPDKKVVVLCDRGVMDVKAEMSEGDWTTMLDENGWSIAQLRDDRYDAILHLVTAVDGAEEFYKRPNDQKKEYNGFKILVKDKKIQQVWVGHPTLQIIDNSIPGFKNKIKRCLKAIYQILNLPEATTFYKKYLITQPNIVEVKEKLQSYVIFNVEETFLVNNDMEEKITIRKQDCSCIYNHTKRRKAKDQWIEEKRQISAREFVKLQERIDKNLKVMEKTRQCILYNRAYMVIDTYNNINGTPSILKILQEEESKDPIIPSIFSLIREVTDEDAYSNIAMAKPDWKMPEGDKEQFLKAENEEKRSFPQP